MPIKTKLTILNFLQFFSMGSWLLSAGTYMIVTLGFNGFQVGAVYATLGIASTFMPPIVGIIADKWFNAEKVYGFSHFVLVILFAYLSYTAAFNSFYITFLLIALCYMPTLALNNAISFHLLEKEGLEPSKSFPGIRVWGTVGFIIAAWVIDLMDIKLSNEQFYLGASTSLCIAIFSIFLPTIPINKVANKSVAARFGLDAFKLFKGKNFAIFLFFSFLLGTILQITNIWGVPFLDDFKATHQDSFVVKHSIFLMTISQISEVVFILAIPYFLKHYGIKKVVAISIMAWVFRFGFFAIGNPEGIGLIFLVLSMIIYGVAFDFYFISGSLYVNQIANPNIRAGAQGLFIMMINGFGSAVGGYASGIVVDFFSDNVHKNWTVIWLVFAGYAFIIAIAFMLLFQHQHSKK